MKFKKVDIDNTTEEELMSVLKENANINKQIKEQIQKMSKVTESSEIEIKEVPSIPLTCPKIETKEENGFLTELDCYVSEFKKLDWRNIKDKIDDVLPVPDSYNYTSVILRLILEISKDIKDINEIITEEVDTLTDEELKEYKDEVLALNNTISILKGKLEEDTNIIESTVAENRIVFTPTGLGNIRVFDELKDIPQEYYEGFLGLFKSIKNGSFKNFRRFEYNNKLAGLMEVKDFQKRVAFVRISENIYLIVSMFVKKNQNNNGYRKALEAKYAESKSMIDTIKKNIENEEFMHLQKEYELELFRLLSGEKENDNSFEYTNQFVKKMDKKDNNCFDELTNNINRGEVL